MGELTHTSVTQELEATPPQPEYPEWLPTNPISERRWNKLCNDLRLIGALSRSDGEQIAVAVEAWLNYINCKNEARTSGLFKTYPTGHQVRTAAHDGMRDWLKVYQTAINRLGLNPASRRTNRIHIEAGGAKSAPTRVKQKSRHRL